MEGFITEPNDIYLWNIVTYGAHRRHHLLFIICKYHSIFLCVTTGSVALLVYKPFVYFIILYPIKYYYSTLYTIKCFQYVTFFYWPENTIYITATSLCIITA